MAAMEQYRLAGRDWSMALGGLYTRASGLGAAVINTVYLAFYTP